MKQTTKKRKPSREYLDWTNRLAQSRYKEWEDSSPEITQVKILNDNTYDYERFFNENREEAERLVKGDSSAHFPDTYKTVYHPTFSNESVYSGLKSEFNPRATIGAAWGNNSLIINPSQIINNDFNYDNTRRYLDNSGEKEVNIINSYRMGVRNKKHKFPHDYLNSNGVKYNTLEDNLINRVVNKFALGTDGSKQNNKISYRELIDAFNKQFGHNKFKKYKDDDFVIRGLTIINQLIGAGYSPEISAAILGNLVYESGGKLDPTAIEKGKGKHNWESLTPGVGYGIAQWTNQTRQDKLKKFAEDNNLDIRDLGTQVAYLLTELAPINKDGEWMNTRTSKYSFDDWKALTDINKATAAFMHQWERPNYEQGLASLVSRQNYANEFYYLYNNYNNLDETNPWNLDKPISLIQHSSNDNSLSNQSNNNVAEDNLTKLNKFIKDRFDINNKGYNNSNTYRLGANNKRYKPNIIRGGKAIPLGNNYYYMQGKSHEQGGIDIGKDIEVEGGEVMHTDKNNVSIYSSIPMINGHSPAELVMKGFNPKTVLDMQEDFKKKFHLNDDGTTKGYRKRYRGGTKAEQRFKNQYKKENSKGEDWDPETDDKYQKALKQFLENREFNLTTYLPEGIGLGADVLGSTLSYFINRDAINKMQAPKAPTLYTPASIQAAKLKTKININPQLNRMVNSLAEYYKMIDDNTASSQTATQRKNLGRLELLNQLNELYAKKQADEDKLINQDRLNQQSVNQANIEAYNAQMSRNAELMDNYYNNVNAFNNKRLESIAENNVSLFSNLGAGINNFITNIRKAYKDRRDARMLALANPQGASAAGKITT